MSRARDIPGFPRDIDVACREILIARVPQGLAMWTRHPTGHNHAVQTLKWPDLSQELCGIEVPSGIPDPWRAHFAVFLLGPIRVFRARERVVGGWRLKSLELLAYLSVHPLGAAKDQILEALWPQGDPRKTQQNLWRTVSFLRARLGTSPASRIVNKVDDMYRLDLDDVWVDAVAFERAVTMASREADFEATLRLACDLYKGEFCEGRYFSWATGAMERLRSLSIEAASKLSIHFEQNGNPEFALLLLDRAICLDPYDEGLYRRAMVLEAERGRFDQVMRRFRRVRRLLVDDLGIEPSPDTFRALLPMEQISSKRRPVK